MGGGLPIAFDPRKLTRAELHYWSVDREALSLVYRIKGFNIWAKMFQLFTAHKPLVRLFGEKRDLFEATNYRLVRWAL